MSAAQGYVYVMLNSAMPGVVKIGATLKDPLQRARELSAPTSSPAPFVVAYSRLVAYPFQVEAALHRIFKVDRLYDSREFFRSPLQEVIKVLETYDELRGHLYADDVYTPFANLFAQFPDDGSPRELTAEESLKCRELESKLRTYGSCN